MSVLVVGSTALDSIKTPWRENPRLLGGSASHAAVAASFFAPVKLVGVVGEDFPKRYLALYRRHGVDLEGLQVAAGALCPAGQYCARASAPRARPVAPSETDRRRHDGPLAQHRAGRLAEI